MGIRTSTPYNVPLMVVALLQERSFNRRNVKKAKSYIE